MREKNILLTTGLIVAIAVLLAPQFAYSIYRGKPEQASPEFCPTRLIVKLEPEADRQIAFDKVQGKVTTGLARLDSLNLRFKVAAQRRLFEDFKGAAGKVDRFWTVHVLEVPEGTDLRRMQQEYESGAEVEYAELDYRLELFEEPDDPLFSHQWYLNNTGQGYLGVNRRNHTQVIKYGAEDADIDALEVFERNDETTIPLVGIIDTGLDLDHPDLADNVWTNPGEIPENGIDDDHNGFVDDFYGWDFGDHFDENNQIVEDNDPTDYYGHGTHCAGIAASVRDNAVGVSGINTPCKIMAIKVFPCAFHSVCAKGIIYAADNGCEVINMSWGGPFASRLIQDALDYAVDKGVLPVAAAGNSGGEDYFYPASFPQVFTVGASNSRDEVTYFSTYGDHIEVVAPGEDVLSLRADSTDMYAEGGATGPEPGVHIVDGMYYLADGTSMASPCVVAVAAYIRAASPGLSNQRVIEIIQESADDIIHPYGGDTLYSPGKDIYSGYGRVNVNSAVQLLSGRLAKIDYPYENAIVSGQIAITGTASGDSFVNYVLEYGEGLSPEEWVLIASSQVPVRKDTLGVWNSSDLTGLYTIRLTVGDQNQAAVRVRINNGVDVKITSPADGDTVVRYTEIWGHAIAPDFSRYVLEYGYGEWPSFWIPIDTSTKMVAGELLGSWLVSFLDETSYALRLTVETSAGETHADTVVVYVKSIVSGGWFAELASLGSLSPAVGDIDGDGHAEIVVGRGGYELPGGVEVFSHQGEREVGWPRDANENMLSSPALGDLDGDGIDDIVICSQNRIHAYLSDSPDWSRPASMGGCYVFSTLATPIIGDLENDGSPEVLTMSDGGTVYAWRNDGESVIPGGGGVFAQTEAGSSPGFPSAAVADLDKDGENEVIAAAAHGGHDMMYPEGGIYIWNIEANPVLGPEDYPDAFVAIYGIAVANIDDSEDLEIIALGSDTSNFRLCAFKKNGSQLANYPITLEGMPARWWFANPPAVGDLDGDGALEIVISVWTLGEGRIYGWHQDGTPLGSLNPPGLLVSHKSPDRQRKMQVLSTLGSNIAEATANIRSMSKEELSSILSPSDDAIFATVAETFGSPVLADVKGDGNVDIVARAGYYSGTGYERVFAWDYEGNLIPGFPLFASAVSSPWTFYPYIPLVDDVDRDGKLNIVIVSDWPDYKLICWELDTDYDIEGMHWPKYVHDKWNSGRYGFKPPAGESVNVPPLNFHAESSTDSSVTLAWTPKAPWTSLGYNIYRATVSGQPGQEINGDLIPPSDSQYQDLGVVLGETYYYTITNVNPNYEESARSPELAITVGQPSAPIGLVAQVDGGTVTLSWRPNPLEESVSRYMLYCKAPNYSDYFLVDSVAAETSYVDSSLKWAGTHLYRITAVHSIGVESYPSEALQLNIEPTGYPVRDFKIASWYGTDVTLSWRVSQAGDGCNVYRSTFPNIYDHPPVNSLVIDDPTGTALAFQDGGLTEGVTYYYVVTQILDGVEIQSSAELEFLAGRPQTITSFTAEVRDCHVVVHWNPSQEGDLIRYRIYDMVPPKDFFALADSVEGDTVHVDPATDDSLAHNFLVTAVDSLGLESFFPDGLPASVNGPLYPPGPPAEFRMLDYTDTSITFKVFSPGAQAYNIYRSGVSGVYNQPPINAEPIPSYFPYEYTYHSADLTEGESNFFNATCIKENECGTAESSIDTATEICFIPGQPTMVTGVAAELDNNCHAVVSWNPSLEGDIIKYRIYRTTLYGGDFQVKDSVLALENLWVDTALVDTLKHYYVVTAVDSLGLEGPFSAPAWVSPSRSMGPVSVDVVDWTDTSVALRLRLYPDVDIIGCNVYRSLVAGDYAGLKPINDTSLSVDSTLHSYYTDLDVIEGTTYFYTGTTVNKCGFESEIWTFDDREAEVLIGRPHQPRLEVLSAKGHIKLCISSSETDVKGYKILRSENQGAFTVIEPLHLDTVYADTFALAGIQYHYKVSVIDTLGLEGEASGEAEGCVMTFDKGIIVVDMTRGRDIFDGVKGDSVGAFYGRALEGYDYAYLPYDSSVYLSLFDLSSHPIAIVHSEDEPLGLGVVSRYSLLKRYLQAGGALFIEGRKNLWEWRPPWQLVGGFIDFSPGDFKYDYLSIDSAHIPDNLQSGVKPEFVGASGTPHREGYPETVEVDTFRVNHAYDPYWFDLQGKLPGVGYFMPLDYSEVLYTFVSAYDTSASSGRPVALKHFTDDFAVIYFDFPLYFAQEDIAVQILHQAISDLQEFVDRPAPTPYAGDLVDASVFPNPFKPYQGHTHITFDGLTRQAKIEVFTIAGEKVCTIEETDEDGEVSWDVTNSKGKKLASGIYIYRITNDHGDEKISKFAIIR